MTVANGAVKSKVGKQNVEYGTFKTYEELFSTESMPFILFVRKMYMLQSKSATLNVLFTSLLIYGSGESICGRYVVASI